MKHCPVIFIAYKGFDNLGVGYMQSVLSLSGYNSKILDLAWSEKSILRKIKELNPAVVGFSVIFEENLERYCDVVRFLRAEGINCHFTAGGHFASLKYRELFEYMPGLDSIVRFEGENILLELVTSICNGSDWRNIDGLAWKAERYIVSNKPRLFERELDKFPFPQRLPLRTFAFSNKFATMLAGRGCVHNCSFCNSRRFYEYNSGPVKRLRSPENVAEEMLYLYKRNDCRIFLFVDDDFPVRTRDGSDWIVKFCDELNKKGLVGKILWKMCCRSDEIDEDLFRMMKKNGLFMVFIGIENGTDEGLKMMNKGVTAAQNREGIRILKKLGIGIDFGFLIFHPSTTYKSFSENLDFLRENFGRGADPVTVTKMIPSYGTRIENELLKDGRLKVSGYINDYDFPEPSMNEFYRFITSTFSEWRNDPYGVVSMAKLARNNYLVFFSLFQKAPEIARLHRRLIKIVSDANRFYLDTLKEVSMVFESGRSTGDEAIILDKFRKRIGDRSYSFRRRIIENIDELMFTSLMVRLR